MRRAAAVAALVAALAMAGCSDDDAEPRDEPELATTGDTGDTFLYGHVTDEGQPVEDAQIQLYLWPEDEKLKVGQTVQPFLVDAEMDDGEYHVTLDPDDIPVRYRGDGFQNFEIQVWRGGRVATVWNATMTHVDGVWRTHMAEGDQLMRLDFDLGNDSLTVTSSDGSMSEEDLPGLSS